LNKILGIIPEVQEAAAKEPSYQPNRQALLHFGLGKRLLSKGFTSKALPEFVKSAEADTNYPDAYIYLGYTMIKEEDKSGAEAPLLRAMELDPSRSAPVLLRAHLLVGSKTPADALTLLEQFYAELGAPQPGDAEAGAAGEAASPDTLDLAGIKALVDEGKTQEACEALDKILAEKLEGQGFSVLKKKRSGSIMERMKLMMENKEQQ